MCYNFGVRLLKHLIFISFLVIPTSLPALLVLSLNLEEIVKHAEQIFEGECLEVVDGSDANNRQVQFITFKVDKTYKGEPGNRFTFKQIVMDSAMELPRYEPGERVILFVSRPGRTGLSAPIGLKQGKFIISEDKDGNKWVSNGQSNTKIFSGMKSLSAFKGVSTGEERREIPYKNFVSFLETQKSQ